MLGRLKKIRRNWLSRVIFDVIKIKIVCFLNSNQSNFYNAQNLSPCNLLSNLFYWTFVYS